MTTENVMIHFNVQLEVENGNGISGTCDSDPYYILSSLTHSVPQTPQITNGDSAIFPMNYGYDSLDMIYRSQSLSRMESQREKYLPWKLHGSPCFTEIYFLN